MALARTNLLGSISTDGVGTGGYTTASFTPDSNSLLVVAVVGMAISGNSAVYTNLTVSGGGWTYTSRIGTNTTAGSYDIGVRIFTAPVTAGASMTFSIGSSGSDYQFLACSVVDYTGYDTGTPTGAVASGTSGATDGTYSITLSGNPATDSEVFAAIAMDKEGIGTTPGAAFSEIHDLQDLAVGGMESEIRTGSTSTTVDWVDTHTGTGSIFKLAAAALEIKASGDAPPATYAMLRPAVVAP